MDTSSLAKVNTLAYGLLMEKSDKKSSAKRLSREDWLYAGFRALCAGGPGAIRAEAIARELKTTKGSFYWHFRDVPEYTNEMLAFWRRKATIDFLQQVTVPDGDPAGQLNQLMQLVSDDRDEIYGGLRAEPAIRQWAVFLPEAAAALVEVDTLRLAWLTARFEAMGKDAQAARIHAGNIYALVIGLEHLEMGGRASLRSGLQAYLGMVG